MPNPAWEGAHAAFHQSLLAACPCATLRAVAEALRERAAAFLRRVLANIAGRGRAMRRKRAAPA